MSEGILKGDLMKQSIVNAPPLEIDVIRDTLVSFLRENTEKYVWLNSRSLNYNMVFEVGLHDDKEITEHIISYLSESSFCEPKDNVLLAVDKEKKVDTKMVPMLDIRDISYNKDLNEVDLFIGLTHFKLSGNSWIVEKIKLK